MKIRPGAVFKVEYLLWSLVGISFFFRLFSLDHLPGINGDEAWSAVHARNFLQGGKFEWITPSRRLLNPLFAVMVILTRFLHEPSFFWLRFPAALSGILLIPLAYHCLGKVLGRSVALVATVLLACLPANIAYSRFSSELCHSGIAALAAICFLFRKNIVGTIIATGAALLVHTTSIFLLPLVFFPLCIEFLGKASRGDRLKTVLFFLGSGLLIFWSVGTVRGALPNLDLARLFGEMGRRLIDPGEFLAFARGFSRLILGWSAYEDFAAEPPESWSWIESVFILFFAILLAAGAWLLVQRKKRPELLYLSGWCLMTLIFYSATGTMALAPGSERYALFLCTPTVILAAILLSEVCSGWGGGLATKGSAAIFSAFFLWSFWQGYFVPLRNGGFAHRTYRTASKEPKLAAFETILRQEEGSRRTAGEEKAPVPIIAESWWLYWPLRYLAGNDPRFHVYYVDRELSPGMPEEDVIHDLGTVSQLLRKGGYLVVFRHGEIADILGLLPAGLQVASLPVDEGSSESLLQVYTARR